jgi:hypothetical protein
MTSVSVTPDSLKATTELLRAELPRLEEHQQTLESELATVTERLEFVRTALAALQALSLAPQAPAPAGHTDTAGPGSRAGTDLDATASSVTEAAEDADSSPAAGRAGRTAATVVSQKQYAEAPKKRSSAKKAATSKRAKAVAPAQPVPSGRDKQDAGLTEQVIEILARSGGSPVRARDVASALGRDESAGSVNAVRSTLDRLVATSRADRAGRGLYQSRS